MKKIISLGIVCMFSIILTGCGKKTLICEGSITDAGLTSAVKVTGNFENDKLKNQYIEMDFDLTNYLQYADIDTYYDSFTTQYEEFNNYDGITVSVSKGETSIKVDMDIDLSKVDEETYKMLEVGNGSLEVSSKAFEEEFINMGLTCNK